MPELRIKRFIDCCDIAVLRRYPFVDGITTNPSLLRNAGVANYTLFAKRLLTFAAGLPVSIAVLSTTPAKILSEGLEIARWSPNAWVKIPIVTPGGDTTLPAILALLEQGIMVNITCLMTEKHVQMVLDALPENVNCCLSVFAGRIADTGRDPAQWLAPFIRATHHRTGLQWLWASARELLNIRQASEIGCHIITLTPDLWAKCSRWGQNLDAMVMETVHQFAEDIDLGNYSFAVAKHSPALS